MEPPLSAFPFCADVVAPSPMLRATRDYSRAAPLFTCSFARHLSVRSIPRCSCSWSGLQKSYWIFPWGRFSNPRTRPCYNVHWYSQALTCMCDDTHRHWPVWHWWCDLTPHHLVPSGKTVDVPSTLWRSRPCKDEQHITCISHRPCHQGRHVSWYMLFLISMKMETRHRACVVPTSVYRETREKIQEHAYTIYKVCSSQSDMPRFSCTQSTDLVGWQEGRNKCSVSSLAPIPLL